MSLWARGKWYWADFSVNGLRYRVPLRDSKGRKIRAEEAYREMAAGAEGRAIERAERGQLAPRKERFGRLPLTQAADDYLASRKLELAASSIVKETDLTARLKDYYANTRLSGIKPESVLAYRAWRAKNGVGPALINMEVGALRRILKRAKLWHLVGTDVKPLKEPETVGRALTFDERTRLFRVAAQRPEWETTCWAATVAVSTTARGCELRPLQWRNVDFINRALEIPRSKTEAGVRVVPLTEEAYDALLKLRRRAEIFGPAESSHFVFAAFRPKFRFKNRAGARGGTPEGLDLSGFDPTRPVGSWRTEWRTLTKKAGLKGLRFHDLRHTAISALGEAGTPDRVIMDIAGHVSMRMLKRYSHIQLEAKRAAIQALSNRPQRGAMSQNTSQTGVKHGEATQFAPQVVENNGRPERTRTVDLYRVKVAL
jgi:integrase